MIESIFSMVNVMSSAVVRWGVLIVALMQFGVASVYAPAHRLLHHTLATIETSSSAVTTSVGIASAGPASTVTGCHAGCCHHHTRKSAAADRDLNKPASNERPASSDSCPDDEESCAWCAVAIQPADRMIIIAVAPALEPIEFVSTFDHSTAAALPATPFDVRGPPVL